MRHRLIFPLIVSVLFGSCTRHTVPTNIAGSKPSGAAERVGSGPRGPSWVSPSAPTPATPLEPGEAGMADRPDVQAFIRKLSRTHRFDTTELHHLFARVRFQPGVLEAMARPYEAKPWFAYKKLFLTDTRIQGGIEFRQRQAQALANAERRYGVSPEIITAILGIESSYGQKPGNYRVVEALATLGFDYPKRAAFFRSELEQFLVLCREEGIDPLQPIGSYAGAMGMPQFMPSSYRRLAADGDGDGRRDIWNNPADAIASVARYFAANGWQAGEPIAAPAMVSGTAYHQLVSDSPKPNHTLARLASMGIAPDGQVGGQPKAALLRLEEETGPAYWLGFQNFYAITRYNHSPLYAMAAYELSQRLVPGR